MIELTEQEKAIILGIAERTSVDIDGDILEIFVNGATGDVSVLERFKLTKSELAYVKHDRKITAELCKKRTWFDHIKGTIRKIGRSSHHGIFYF